MQKFKLKSEWAPAGDQPQAIRVLTDGLRKSMRHQTLLGVTGSGKTFTVANVIANIDKPTLVIAHNKTLAAQLAQEYQEFFPENAVHYFVSYYDYYQPEAYMPITDTYIEKDAQINEEIDRLRHASTQALLTRRDVIIVASVSCIYGIGSPEEYQKQNLTLRRSEAANRRELIKSLVAIYFTRTNADLTPGTFRAVGNKVEIMPVHERIMYSIEISDGKISSLFKINALTSSILDEPDEISLFPAKHFITEEDQKNRAIILIKEELKERLGEMKKDGKVLEYERLKRRTTYDLAMIREVGYCSGIENYSRHFSGKRAGEPPETLLSYFPRKEDGSPDFLTIIDESHATVPQIGGMYAGDASRKKTLVEHGFRLPSALDNRPLTSREFGKRVGQVIYTSATPGTYEREVSMQTAEQVLRPTGLVDPKIDVRPITEKGGYGGQIADFIKETEREIKKGGRVIATTLTKKMAEDLSEYLKEKKVAAEYLHSDIKTMDRIKVLTDFRKGSHADGFDCLVGVNLLREGLDLPEVSFIGILDADKEGFLRSETALIQTIGRAARNVLGRVILYADTLTGSMERAIKETDRRRSLQLAYNKKHGITPKSIVKNIRDITEHMESQHVRTVRTMLAIEEKKFAKHPKKFIALKEKRMSEAVKILDFETAAILRDEIKILKERLPRS
ncbi:MAG: excinuclease ABC subunit UvrB [Patescibacteria group bacterium]|nr:MAG: excinuclease ABC subunit UvrB [Patescibacteria group bacterium]